MTITDEFRTGIDSIIGEKNYTQPAPTGELEGVDNGGHTNGIVKFSWDDEAKVTVTKDGEEIDLKQKFDEDEDAMVVVADDETLNEDQVMTTMDGFQLDEDSEEGNMFDESSIYEDQDDMLEFDDYGTDEM